MRKTKMRLAKYTSEEKRHYKLYKRKKTWVIAGITMFSSAVLLQVPALADEVTTLTLGESTTAQGTIQTDDKTLSGAPTTDQTAQETLATDQTSVEKESTATDETNEVTGASTAKTESESVQTKEDTTTNTQTEQPNETTPTQAVASTSSFRSVAAVSDENAQAEEKVIHLTSVSQENSGILDKTTAADGSTEYTFTTDNTSPNRGRLSMTVEYTGQNGDTFSMIVKPNATKGGILEAAGNIDATGSPQKTALGDGSYKYTWTITGAANNTNVTVKQTIKPVNFFAELVQNGAETYPPYLGSVADDGMTVSGDNYQISFLINDVPAPTSTNVKITLDKRLLPAGAKVETKADAYKENTTTNVTTDTNYLYQVEILDGNVVANVPTTVRGLAQVKVPVPEHFVLDVAETNKYLMHTSDPYLNGNLQVTQPGGEGTPIILTATKPIVFTTTSAKLSFIGHYTSTQTTGKSEAPSGWVDLGDGQRKYFGTVNIDTGEALDPSGLSPEAKGFDQNVLAKYDPSVHENFGLIIHYSNSEQNSNRDVVLVSDYNSVKNSGTSVSDQKIDPVERPILDNGDKSAPVLYAVGLTANGLTEFTPTYHFEFPDEITTTGITLPINNVTNDHADFKSYNPAQTGYTVVVTGSDGSQITQRLQAGEHYDPLTGQIDHFGEFRMGKKLASGVKITAYDVTPDVKYYANALQNSINGTNGSSALNDINSGMINILGYLNSKAQVGQTYSSKIQVESENKRLTTAFQVNVSEPKALPLQGYEWPSKNSETYVKKPGDEFSMGFQTMGSVSTPSKGTNLDAGGVLVGKGNGTATDLPGHALTVEYGTVREPIVYLTVPEQTVLTNFAKSDKFYQVTYDKKYQNPVTPEPKIIQKQNINGQTVVILDWTGTGFELKPQMKILFNLKVVSDAVSGFDVGRTLVDLYAYAEPGKEPALYTEADLKKKGVSTDGLQVYKANVNATNNTSWIQLGGDTSKTELSASLQTQIQFADGTIAKTTMTDTGANTIQFRIVAPEEIKPAPLIQGTKNYSLSDSGSNYPAKDYLEKDGQKQGLQTLQFGMVNNLATALNNVISVMNLPQAGVVDGNNPSAAAQAFTLNISDAGKLALDPTNNHLHDAHTLYYATQAAVLSDDGRTLTFADGTTWTSGQPIPSTLLTADQVTDWSMIKALVLDVPTLSIGNKIIYHLAAYSPTSETNMGKQVTLRQVGGYAGQKTLVVGTITDSYGTYATVKFVDQAGVPINGYPDLVGKATLNETTGEYELENSYLLGDVGKALSLPTPPTITGYKFVENQYSSTVFKADGSTVITRVYQVDQARLFENSLQGKLLDQATGDPQAGMTQATPTGTSEIKFTVTDEQLKRPGYTYKITVVDQNGTPLTNKVYDSLTEALEEQGIFDDKIDGQSVTQNFIVTYTADFQKAVIISDNDPSKQIPTSEAEATTAPYFHDGKTDGLMFYDQAGAPLVSDAMFARAGYRYTVIAPDGKTYNNFAAALAAKLRFDNTDNTGNSDSEVQVYRVVYTEDIQKILVTIIDDQGQLNDDGSYTSTILVNKELLGQGLAGSAPSEETSQKYADMIKEYRDKGYEVVSKEELPTYDQDETTDQVVTVHLKHGTKTQEKTVKLTQTVTYKYKDGVHAEENAAPTYTKEYSFTATETVDLITNKVIQTKWSEPQMTEVVTSPTIAGYKADKTEVAAMQVSHDTEETALQTVVYYTPNIQKLNYKVIDDQTGTEIVVTTLLAQGGSETDIPESVQTEYATKIADLQKQGYVIVSQDKLPLVFDTDDASDQLVVVHVKHGTKEVAGTPKTVTQTVTYVYGNGPKKGQSAADTYTKDYQFTSVDTIDTVTGEILSTVWSPAQTTEVIQSPTITGYTPDRDEISGQTITHDSEDLSTVVTYTAGDQTVKVHYIDVYDGANKELTDQLQTITGKAGAAYTNTLWDYAQVGYKLVSAQPEATSGNFDEDPDTEQEHYVYLTHELKQVVGTPVTVSQTINYVYRTGPKAGQMVSADSVNSHTFVPTYTVDQVTKENVGEPSWAPETAEFSAVTSPTVSGYTSDRSVVEKMTITPSSKDSVVTVYYDANEQRLTYTVIDDGDNGKVLANNELLATGDSESVVGDKVSTDYQALIQSYLDKGYVLVSADALPVNFDNNDAVDQNVVLHLAHGTKEVAGTPKTVTQTVTYVYGNGPKKGQPVTEAQVKEYVFTSTDTIDTVTGAILSTVWSPAQTTEVIQSPTITGYTPDRDEISGQTITHDSEDLSTVVTYTAGDQTVKVHYIDVYNGANKELTDQLQTITGKAGAAYTNTLWDYAQAGYELVSAQPEATSGNFDEDPDADQEHYVYLTHALKQVVGTPVTVSQTINYVYRTGPKAGQMVSADSVNSHTFVPTYTVDQVTKENVGEPSWAPETAEFSAVMSPTVSGYTSDQPVVEKMTITPSSKDSVVTVYYDANEQRLTYTVIDDGDNGKVLADNELLATGDSESVVGDKVSTDYQALIQSYLDKGYVLVSADALPVNFDNNDAVDQNVVLHLAHGTKEVVGTPKTVTQTVTYVYGNGPKKGQPVTEAQVKEYVFTSTDTIDTVTGAILSTAWSPAQTTEMIQSPTIAGYTPDRNEISGQTITHDSEDLSTVVTYTAGDQTVKVHYIDAYGGANKELTGQLQTITGKAGAAYTNTLWDYAQAGYELVSAQPEATAGNFDEDPDADQEHYVYLTHALKQVVGTPVTVNQTINYVYRTGPKAGQMVSADSVNSHTFVPTYTVDQVTRENVGEPSWAPETAEFSAVTSPTVSGYTSDRSVVEKMTITPSSKDSVVTVYYDANEQRLTYTVIDDGDNGKVLANNELLATGDSESVVGDKVSTDYQALIQSYLDKGYVLVSADALPANFDNNDAVDQKVVLHLAHGTKEVVGTPKTVTQTVTYVYGNGPKKGQPVTEAQVKEYVFTSTDTIDTVTGAILSTVWSPAQTTEALPSPTITGYTPDRNEISGQTITHDSEDLSTVVTYTVGDQTVKVHYIDVYGGANKELTDQLQTITGKAGSAYTNTLWDYAQAGYELVSAQPEATVGNFDEDPDADQEHYVYLTHALKQVVGTPVVITDTINYVYGNGPKQGQPVYPPSVIEKTFVPTYTIDAVTGETIETTWSGDGKIASSAVPDIPGYTPDKTLIAERVLTPTMADQTQTVQYMLDEVPETKPDISNDPTKAESKQTESLEENNDTRSSIEGQKGVETQAPISEKASETQTKAESKVQLPQTGDASDTQKASFVGAMLTTLAGLLGFATKKRKKEDE